jgi:hypothetical protein
MLFTLPDFVPLYPYKFKLNLKNLPNIFSYISYVLILLLWKDVNILSILYLPVPTTSVLSLGLLF